MRGVICPSALNSMMLTHANSLWNTVLIGLVSREASLARNADQGSDCQSKASYSIPGLGILLAGQGVLALRSEVVLSFDRRFARAQRRSVEEDSKISRDCRLPSGAVVTMQPSWGGSAVPGLGSFIHSAGDLEKRSQL